ncbi:uncharacterized protein C8orf74 homolog [Chelmon rostratus]|uniref:uncharacterized protein C8orf74 homolog n=1 Tax=Chelmon rostratus TaxID=109905 RepID=UPI001BEBF351|nr:uncharacterized protein C8orf74 homolog [Chelmon rostratus]
MVQRDVKKLAGNLFLSLQGLSSRREAGVQRLSCHFSWPEFCDERRRFHQEFAYDVAMFATACGFPWPDVIRAAVAAKGLFPQLDGLDVPKLLALLKDVLSEFFPNLTSVHRHKLTQFLTDTCVTRRRLFQAVVGGATNMPIVQLHLEVQLPPTPCPLVKGMDLHEWEHQRRQAELTSMLRLKEEKLKVLRLGSRVTLAEVNVPDDDDNELDKEGVLALVQAAVKATEGQMLASLTQEASLLSDILQLKLQQAALTTGRLHNPVPSTTGHISSHPDAPVNPKPDKAKPKTGLRESGNAVSTGRQ